MGNLGTLVVGRDGWEVIPEYKNNQPEMERVELQPSSGRGMDLHLEYFVACIKDKSRMPEADINIGANVAQIELLGNIAYKTGRGLYWDGDAKSFINDTEANDHLVPEYRAPWKLPKI